MPFDLEGSLRNGRLAVMPAAVTRDHLNDYSTTTFNGKTVYQADATTPFNNSVNVIQAQIVYPGYACNRFSPPAVRQIGFDTIEQAAALGRWTQDNMAGQGFYPAAQRIGGFDVEQLIGHFKQMIVQNRYIDFPVYIAGAGLWEFHHQLCVQAYDQGLVFFPDFPAGRRARFVRLRMPGALLVSGEFADGQPKNLTIHSEKGNPCTVFNPWGKSRGLEIREQDGPPVPAVRDGERYTFKTTAGKTYRLEKK